MYVNTAFLFVALAQVILEIVSAASSGLSKLQFRAICFSILI